MALENKIKIVFSDVDHTLIHKLEARSDLVNAVKDMYISKSSQGLIKKIMEKIPFCLVTARKHSRYLKFKEVIPHSHAILEYGCLLIENEKVNEEYSQLLAPYIGIPFVERGGLIWDYEKSLSEQGIITNHEDRHGTFNIYYELNGLSEKDLDRFKPPKGIEVIRYYDCIEFYPSIGKKTDAISFLLSKLGIDWRNTLGLGDGMSDMDLISNVDYAMTLKGCEPEILKLVEQKKGYVSPYSTYKGTEDMLEHVLEVLG